MICPIGFGESSVGSVSISEIDLEYYDGSAASVFFCLVEKTTYTGSRYTSPVRWTCSTPGGCACGDSGNACSVLFPFTGYGFLDWGPLFYDELHNPVSGMVGMYDTVNIVCEVGPSSIVKGYAVFQQ